MHSAWDMDWVSVTPYRPATEEHLLRLPCNGLSHARIYWIAFEGGNFCGLLAFATPKISQREPSQIATNRQFAKVFHYMVYAIMKMMMLQHHCNQSLPYVATEPTLQPSLPHLPKLQIMPVLTSVPQDFGTMYLSINPRAHKNGWLE